MEHHRKNRHIAAPNEVVALVHASRNRHTGYSRPIGAAISDVCFSQGGFPFKDAVSLQLLCCNWIFGAVFSLKIYDRRKGFLPYKH
jgi:hypothetical protein